LNVGIFLSATGPSFAPQVYLNGTLLFVSGLAIVRAHNHWIRGGPVLVTFVGWLAMFAGLARMVAPVPVQQAGRHSTALDGSLIVLFAVGVILTFKSYRRSDAT
jgi:hypothetical protein